MTISTFATTSQLMPVVKVYLTFYKPKKLQTSTNEEQRKSFRVIFRCTEFFQNCSIVSTNLCMQNFFISIIIIFVGLWNLRLNFYNLFIQLYYSVYWITKKDAQNIWSLGMVHVESFGYQVAHHLDTF